MKFIIGNWKSNKNASQVEDWFVKFSSYYKHRDFQSLNCKVVICPSYIHLYLAKKLVERHNLPIVIGAQDVSPFKTGPFTGEISASQLSEVADYVIIGHSERRENFSETNNVLKEKTKMAKKKGLSTVFCISNTNSYIPETADLVAYEPVWAIGTGKSEDPLKTEQIANQISKKGFPVIYGGSVSNKNIIDYFSLKSLSGVLPGGASLDPKKFWEMIVNVSAFQKKTS